MRIRDRYGMGSSDNIDGRPRILAADDRADALSKCAALHLVYCYPLVEDDDSQLALPLEKVA